MFACNVPCRARASRLLLALAILWSSTLAQSAPLPEGCKLRSVPVDVSERINSDTYHSPKISGGLIATVFSASRSKDVLQGRKIVDEEPTSGLARLSDGSGLSFDRDCRGFYCVYLGLKTTPEATKCWLWLSGNSARNRNKAGEYVFGDGSKVAIKNTRFKGFLVLRDVDSAGRRTEVPLIVTTRPIIGFGVSAQALHQPVRNLDIIKRETDGALSLVSYALSTR